MPKLGLACIALEVKGGAEAALTLPDSRAAARLPSTHVNHRAGGGVWFMG